MIGPKGILILVGICASLAGWGLLERAGRINAGLRLEAAQHALAQAEERIRNMEVRREEDDRAGRDPDPVGSLRNRWSRD